MSQPPFTVLLVEDNPVSREMWSLYLTNEGFEVATAENGLDALDLVAEQTIDMVILDVMLPGLDGFEVLAKLRQSAGPEELPVIMATSRDKSEDIVRGFELGANDYITKPVHLEVLLKRIESQLRTKSSRALAPKADLLSQDPVPKGTVLDGRFEVEELIGRGSCGAVYRAKHVGLDRSVAIKLLTAAAGIASEKRLRREGISACRIEHPNAVEVLDFCVTESVPFLVMQLLRGHSLDQEVREQGRLTPVRCARILMPICEVLADAHSQGIIHRDVKPHNVFLHQAR
ncbi:MAG: response regulator, partial [Thermoanaerobaculia bacterium]